MDPDRRLVVLLFILLLLIANAVFVAVEFALLTARRTLIEEAADDSEIPADRLPAPGQADRLSLAAQLGSSFASLLVGVLLFQLGFDWVESRVRSGGWQMVVAIAIAVTVTGLLHAVLAGQIPKLVGAQRAERILRSWLLPAAQVWALLLRPFIWITAFVAHRVAGVLGLSASNLSLLGYTPEEIRLIVTRGHEQGTVEEDEREMIHGVFEFSETVAREVMTPRTDVIALPVDAPLAEVMRISVDEGHSRIPVYESSIDNIVGVLLVKDLLPLLWAGLEEQSFDVRRVMREPYFVPDTKPVDDLLAEFQMNSVHLAIVLDEFGGTHGLVTMEDLLEEIVGEIHDEFDIAQPEFTITAEGDIVIDGGASIDEVNTRFGLALPEQDFDTIGGFVFGALGRVPEPGECVEDLGGEQRFSLRVERVEDRRVTRVRLIREPELELEPSEETAAETSR